MCELVLREQLINSINNSHRFSILADETADISGVEQLSLGARFGDTETMQVREEFLGCTPLEEMDAKSISNRILQKCSDFALDLDKLIGQGYDGCSTMVGKENEVQSRIRQYPKAVFCTLFIAQVKSSD